jgi:PRC-barrel domain
MRFTRAGQGKRKLMAEIEPPDARRAASTSDTAVPDIDTVADWRGRRLIGTDGDTIGSLKEIYLDEDTDLPAWAAVGVGRLGIRRRLVPLMGAEARGESVRVPVQKGQVGSAPKIDPNGWVTERQRRDLYRHYGLPEVEERESPQALDRGSSEAELPPDRVRGQSASAEAGAAAAAERSPGDPPREPEATASGGLRLKRYVVTETVRKRSEFARDG